MKDQNLFKKKLSKIKIAIYKLQSFSLYMYIQYTLEANKVVYSTMAKILFLNLDTCT